MGRYNSDDFHQDEHAPRGKPRKELSNNIRGGDFPRNVVERKIAERLDIKLGVEW